MHLFELILFINSKIWYLGLDVVNVGLSAVLYNTETHEYYTPNTNQTSNINNPIENTDEIEYNKDDTDLKYNHNHSNKDGRFTGDKSISSNSSLYENKVKRLSKKEMNINLNGMIMTILKLSVKERWNKVKEKIDKKLKEIGFDEDDRQWVIRIYDDNQEQLGDLYKFICNPDFNLKKREEMLNFAFEQNPDYYSPIEVIDDDEFDRLVKEGIIDEDGNPIEVDE